MKDLWQKMKFRLSDSPLLSNYFPAARNYYSYILAESVPEPSDEPQPDAEKIPEEIPTPPSEPEPEPELIPEPEPELVPEPEQIPEPEPEPGI